MAVVLDLGQPHLVITDWAALDFDLGQPYLVITDWAALDFDLAAGGIDGGIDDGFVYRAPPLAVTSGHWSPQASVRAYDNRTQGHGQGKPQDGDGLRHRTDPAKALEPNCYAIPWGFVPAKDGSRNRYSAIDAMTLELILDRARWKAVITRDDPPGYGSQAWSVKEPKDRHEDQGFNDPRDHDVTDPHQAATTILNWQAPPPDEVIVERGIHTLNLIRSPYTRPGAAAVDFDLVTPSVFELEVVLVEAIKPPTRSVDAQEDTPGWSLKDALDGKTIHPWDRKPRLGTEVEFSTDSQPDVPPGDAPTEPEIKRTYIIMNASSLVEVTTNTPLQFKDLSIDLDADSFAWSMSATILNRASMDAIRPTADGPAEVIATINGHAWRFLIERYSLNREFAKESYKVTGVSRAQLLAAPYAPKRTGRIDAQTTVTQAMTEQLEFTGFSVSRQSGLTDYIIPAGAWGWDNKTAMEVITELAAAQGAIVVPDKDLDVLHIRHRYKQAGPWKYAGLPIESIDAIIADAQTTSYSSQWEPQPEYNAVFVSGVTAGIACSVLIFGTAGDRPAPDIFDDLNVDEFQCRERGLTTIAGSGNQEIVTIDTQLPTSGAPGLIEPGMLVEVRDTIEPANTWRGNVLSVSINVGKPGTGKVTQTVKVERHHYN